MTMDADPGAAPRDVEVVANGETRRVPEGTTLAGYVENLGIPASRVAVERNGGLVPRERFASVVLASGDRLEVVTLVGGG